MLDHHRLGFAVLLMLAPLGAVASPPQFVRGDVDGSGAHEITDSVRILTYLFVGCSEGPGTCDPTCQQAADADDNDILQLTDAVYILSYLFLGGQPPPQPFPRCGHDPTPSELTCLTEPAACVVPEHTALFRRFGVIDTLAGKGELQDVNGWLPSYEGGPATAAELSSPHNALGDDAGNVYIADKESHAIRKVTPDGKIFTVAGTSVVGNGSDEPGPGTLRALANPNGLWVRPDGTVYILDLDNGKIRRLAPDGTLSKLFDVPGLTLGRGLWVADDESLAYVSSGAVLKRWTPGGGLVDHSTAFSRLGNLAVNDRGDLLVTDQGTHRVYRVLEDGSREPIAGNGSSSGGGDGEAALETGLNGVRGIWPVPGAGYFLATHAGNQAWYVDTAGIIHLFIDGSRGAHSGDGEAWHSPSVQVSEVRNVTMDRRGNLLITEHDYGYIRIVHGSAIVHANAAK